VSGFGKSWFQGIVAGVEGGGSRRNAVLDFNHARHFEFHNGFGNWRLIVVKIDVSQMPASEFFSCAGLLPDSSFIEIIDSEVFLNYD